MADARRVWTVDDIAARFEEAASTGRRLAGPLSSTYSNCSTLSSGMRTEATEPGA